MLMIILLQLLSMTCKFIHAMKCLLIKLAEKSQKILLEIPEYTGYQLIEILNLSSPVMSHSTEMLNMGS